MIKFHSVIYFNPVFLYNYLLKLIFSILISNITIFILLLFLYMMINLTIQISYTEYYHFIINVK